MGWNEFPVYDQNDLLAARAEPMGMDKPGLWIYEPITKAWVFVTTQSPYDSGINKLDNMFKVLGG